MDEIDLLKEHQLLFAKYMTCMDYLEKVVEYARNKEDYDLAEIVANCTFELAKITPERFFQKDLTNLN